MKEIPNTLFTEETVQRLTSNVVLSAKQKKAAKEWKNYLDEDKIKVETQHEKLFADKILIDLLGFPDVDAGLEQKTNFMDYSIPPAYPKKGIVIELKSRTKNLQTEQVNYPSGKKTPVKQTIYYMRNNHDYDYGICTNYEEFILLKTPDYNQCYSFIFPKKGDDLTEEKIKEFVAIFSKENIDAGFVEKLVHESIIEQRRLTNDFYKLFHATRLMLIRTFEKNSANVSPVDAIKYAQMFLNRLIFVFFAEDNDLINSKLFSEEILNILKKGDVKKGTTKISDHIGTIFKWMDSGSIEIDHKLGFNGEFFKESLTRDAFFYDFTSLHIFDDIEKQTKYTKKPEPNLEIQKIIKQYGNDLNPIIRNLLIMDSYDFRDQINVNILGHIFEQSIGDLEELRHESVSKRKRDGVYYTPDYITEFICQNTIIPHLSKKGISDPDELILEYADDIEDLEKKVNEIKILDPACGSGAFLVQAVNVLLDISDRIQLFKQSKGKYTITKKGKKSGFAQQGTLDKEYDDIKARDIIQNNIYGVDINPESVEITKLSLFLKIASKNKRLIGLSQRIKIGNSLVTDKSIDEKAFDWKSEFAEILDEKYGSGGFDIVVGNPPYLNLKGLHESHDHTTGFFKENFQSATARYDYYVLFVEKASQLLKENGILSFIMPHKFINAQFGVGLRKYLLETKMLQSIISFGHNLVFEDSTTYTCIITLNKSIKKEFNYTEIEESESIKSSLLNLRKNDFVSIPLDELNEKSWILNSGQISQIMNKIKNTGDNIMNFFDMVMSGLQTGDNSIYVLTPLKDEGKNMVLFSEKLGQEIKIEKEILKPLLTGEDVKRYSSIDTSPHYVIYPYVIDDGIQRPLDEDELKNKYPLAYQYLFKFKKELIKLRTSFKTNPKYWHGLHRGRVLGNFEHEKIMTPEISLGCNMTLDTKKFLHLEVVYSLLKKQDTVEDIHYFLGILNSKVMWFFLKNSGDVLRGGYFRFKTMYIEPFSIPHSPNNQIEKDIVKLVKNIILLQKEFDTQSNTFLNLLHYNFKIDQPSKILSNFYSMEFDEFLKELKEKYQIQINITEQVEWLNQFKLFKNKLLNLKNDISNHDDQINKIVYSLYDLNADEITLVEQNYPEQIN